MALIGSRIFEGLGIGKAISRYYQKVLVEITPNFLALLEFGKGTKLIRQCST